MIYTIMSDKFLAMSNNAKLLYLMLNASLDKQYDKVIYNLDTMIKLIDAHDTAKKSCWIMTISQKLTEFII